MADERIDQLFSRLESFWGVQVPEVLEGKDWDDYSTSVFVEDNRGIPNDLYKDLIAEIGADVSGVYSDRLAKLQTLIAQVRPGWLALAKGGKRNKRQPQ